MNVFFFYIFIFSKTKPPKPINGFYPIFPDAFQQTPVILRSLTQGPISPIMVAAGRYM